MIAKQLEARIYAGLIAAGLAVIAYGTLKTGLFDPWPWDPSAWKRLGVVVAILLPVAFGLRVLGRLRSAPVVIALAIVAALIGFGATGVSTVALIMAAALCLGDLALGQERQQSMRPGFAAAFAMAVGLAVIVILIGFAVHFPINTRLSYLLGLLACIAVNHRAPYRHLSALWRRARRPETPTPPLQFWLCAAFALVGIVFLVHAALPERFADAVAVHLMITARVEGLGYWPFDVHSFSMAVVPMGGDWALTVGYLIGGEAAAKGLNYAFFLLLVWLIYEAVAARVGTVAGLLVTLLFATTPVALVVTASAYVENILALFILASVLGLIRFWDRIGPREAAIVMGLVAAAANTKLHGVIVLGLLGLAISYLVLRRAELRHIASMAAVLAVMSAIALFPYAFAYLHTGNPTLPFFNDFFESPFYPVEAFYHAYPGGLPWNLFYLMAFYSPKYFESGVGSTGLQILAFGAAAAVAVVIRAERGALIALAIAAIYIVGVSVNTQYIRYLYPIFPVATLVLAELWTSPLAERRPYASLLTLAALAIAAMNFLLMPRAGWVLQGFRIDALISERERAELVEQQVPQRLMIPIVNALAGPSAGLAIFGPPVAAGLQGKPIYGNWYSALAITAMSKAATLDEMRRVFSRYGITHVMVTLGPADPAQAMAREIIAHYGRELKRVGNVVLYALDPQAIYLHELVGNGGFEHGMTGWTATPSQTAPTGGAASGPTLAPGTWLMQELTPPVRGETRYRYTIEAQCASAGPLLSVVVRWFDARGRELGISSDTASCASTGEMQIGGYVASPQHAAKATLSLLAASPAPVRRVSLLAPEPPP